MADSIEYRENWTLEELAKYNGTEEGKPLLVSLKGNIYDVSSKADMYGPGSAYGAFAGRDASFMLAKMSMDDADANKPWTALDKTQQESLDHWVTFFSGKYKTAGKLAAMPSA